MLRVGVYGGAFSPIHKGHVEAAKAYAVRLVNVKATAAEGAELTIDGNDTILAPKAAHMVVTL